jgi:DNA repair protein RecO (recombination protein O)
MAIEHATALVVRGSDWSETSRVATLWTREFGKIRALAKGGRRLRSNFEVAFDLLTVCRILFIRKPSGLDLLTEAQVAERFPRLRTDLASLYLGYYVAELLADGTSDYDPHPALFDAALHVLRSLDDPGEERAGRAAWFELVWLRELGYSPQLDRCAGCNQELVAAADGRGLGYSPSVGGVLCPACSAGVRDRRPLSGPAWSALKALAGGSATLPAAVRPEVRQVLGQTVSYVLARPPRLLRYVDRL